MTSPDTTAPTAPTGLTPAVISGAQINLSWTASTDNVGVTGYRVERCAGVNCTSFSQIGTPTGTTYNDIGIGSGASYSYRVRATDAAGNLSAYSTVATAVTPDTATPSAPTNLTPSVVSSTQINLSWTASTDNVGVTGYRVERCQGGAGCTNFVQIGTPTATSFNDTGLTASTSYSYRVRATDAAGNLSAYSSVATAVTTAGTDTTPPTAPGNMGATTASSTQINLSWIPSTDNVGVTGYFVERCQGAGCSSFTQITSLPGNSYDDTGLTPGTTYSYRSRAEDAAHNLSPYSGVATATTSASGIAVSITPVRGGLAISQSMTFTATVQNDASNSGVTWSATAGSFSAQTATTTFTAPTTAGAVTVTATSVADPSRSASATIGVTDLTGVTTYHNDLSRDGVNSKEYALTLSNVTTATFGKLFSCTTDGAIYGQPLWVPGLTVNGGKHNVVFVATQHDSLYAFDADGPACTTLWHVSLIDSVHGGSSGETSVPSGPSGGLVGQSAGDITPEVGILGTPVIDLSSGTLYAVSKSVDSTGTNFFQRLHGLDITTGNEKLNGNHPVLITATFPGNGDGNVGGTTIPFDPQTQNQRPGLALVNGIVYVCWASHEDVDPYHGWIIGYQASSLTQVSRFNTTPNTASGFVHSRGGIWMGGGAPAADSNNNLYVITGNGAYDGNTDFGDSVIRLGTTSGLSTSDIDWFTPMDQQVLNDSDLDFGSGGTVVLADLPLAPIHHLLIGGGKAGDLFLLNRDNLGHFSPTTNNVVDFIHLASGEIFATAAFWNNNVYYAGSGSALFAFTIDSVTPKFANQAPAMQSAHVFQFPGATPSVSANGTSNPPSNAIVWALDNHAYCTPQSNGACGPAVLYAFDATNLSTELWNSSTTGNDTAGFAVKFTVPTVANGKVYIGTRGSDDGTYTSSNRGELDVYGLKPN
jgi:fibronectin type 3 domain-containing protein